ncbi:outer membrane lipoprotein LolB [Calidifontimicrobium sp. SYSU G02091]|uniref:lipoprotein insertase outer membrane protein LolB n=1 Tax=Calidifontimicrobium sp. SYSU G02091 TaxID=2926421 RepID=UPI001F53E12E|nr:outer membrane lipoprotein LolB [Calidifontimicrobium sp. SYSU G02091]
MTLRRTYAPALAALALLAGCATAPPAADVIAGRLALQVAAHDGAAERQLASTFELSGNAERGALLLTTPLGTTLAQAHWQPGRVELATGNGARVYTDLDALTRDVLGEALPLAALFDWLRARPWPAAPSEPTAAGFEQLGWSVDLARRADGWIVLQRARPPAVTVRVRLDAAS